MSYRRLHFIMMETAVRPKLTTFPSRLIAIAIGVLAGLTPAPATAAITYAPVNQPSPPLNVPVGTLNAALSCPIPIAQAKRDVVLLIPGTTLTPSQSFSWNYETAFRAKGIPYCSITLPNFTDNDIQVAAEYVVNAVRTIRARSGRNVIMLGWSQGASTLPRWALRFWPDIRPMVASLIGLAPLNNIGSPVASGACITGQCVPAAWQQAVRSHFIAAVNSGQQTFPGIAYTVIYSRFDDVVTPDITGALSVLPSGPNVTNTAIQSICPTETTDHLTIIASPTAYAIAMNAIDHPGQPANLAQVHPYSCVAGTAPYVTPQAFINGEAAIAAQVPRSLLSGQTNAEPVLACYVTASCTATPDAPHKHSPGRSRHRTHISNKRAGRPHTHKSRKRRRRTHR
jgi:triacylglycerol esterase/lipase EstA (alpha/beta hydrolase family)